MPLLKHFIPNHTAVPYRFHLRRSFDDWNRSLESIRVEQLLENPREFVRAKQPLSLPLPSSELAQHRQVVAAEKHAGDAPGSVSGTLIAASKVAAAPPDFASVTSFLQGLWASTNGEPPLHSSGSWTGKSTASTWCAPLKLCGRCGNPLAIAGVAVRPGTGPGCVQGRARAPFRRALGCALFFSTIRPALVWSGTAVMAT